MAFIRVIKVFFLFFFFFSTGDLLAQSWEKMEEDYKSLMTIDRKLAVVKAKEMLLLVFKNEGDTSLRIAISNKLIGNAFSEINSDSAVHYYNYVEI